MYIVQREEISLKKELRNYGIQIHGQLWADSRYCDSYEEAAEFYHEMLAEEPQGFFRIVENKPYPK